MMSKSGHPCGPAPSLAGGGSVLVGSLPMPRRVRLPRHVHHDWHQLVWAAEGCLTVDTDDGTWVLPSVRALWIPAGVPHAPAAPASAVMRSPYLRPGTCPLGWRRPTAINVPPLLRELIVHLAEPGLADGARGRAEAVLYDLVEPVEATPLPLPMPSDARALRVAGLLLDDPADPRTLEAWGRLAGASGRTLARLFERETGMSFGRWRTQARLRAALVHLAEGVPVTAVAHRVGYATPSAFVAVFRRAFGVPPGRYFAAAEA